MTPTYKVTLLLSIVFLVSCSGIDKNVQETLDNISQQRRNELSAFISHYSGRGNMHDGAKFIVANMSDKYSIIGGSPYIYHEYIDSVYEDGTTFNSRKGYDYKSGFSPSRLSSVNVPDIDFVIVDSLTEHFDNAYSVWETTPWRSLYSKELFEKYVLPYRIADEPLEYGWRKDAYERNSHYLESCKDSGIIAACTYIYNNLDYQTNNLFWGEPLQPYSVNVHYRRGTCSDYAVYTAMVMRALGIPVSLDFVPYWGDNNNGHSFNALLMPDGSCLGFNNKDDLNNGLHLSGKVPKVYRKEFEIQRNIALYKYKDVEYIPPLFAGHNIKDVTGDYDIPLTDIMISPVMNTPRSHIVYLAVFSPVGWRPVAWAEYKGGNASFRNVGTGYTSHDSPSTKGEGYGEGCLFIPVCYTDTEDMLPLDYPFILLETGEKRSLIPDTTMVENVVVERKFPRKKRIIEFARKMKGGYFEFSNKPDFSDSEVLFFVNETPSSRLQEIILPENSRYRYVRFYKRRGGISIGEMGCKDETGNVIPGKPVADFVLRDDKEIGNICDGNVLSFFDVAGLDDTWFGLDFGKPMLLRELFFCPRTDDNEISPGDVYEMFYWDRRWKSLGKQKADGYTITYEKVPSNALLWIHNLTKGHEERPFTYENGKQVWW